MRDIEFRFYDTTSSKMYGMDIVGKYEVEQLSRFSSTDDPYTKVMQYTGLKDSKGIKIFEGDILGGGDSVPRCVFFDNGSFRLDHGDDLSCAQVMVQFTVGRLTIIGNIYENPHLIENKEGK